MSRVLGAYGFYLKTAGRNRLRKLASRLRQPRYLIGFLLGVAYLYYFVVRPFSGSGSDLVGSATGAWARVVLTSFYALNVALAWVFGSIGRGLPFREAEVEILFPAPLRRVHLLLFKFMQGQLPLVLTGLVFAVLLGRALPDRSFGMIALSIWLVGNLTSVHGIAVTLLLKSIAARGGVFKMLAFLPGLLLLGLLVYGVSSGLQEIEGLGSKEDLLRLLDTSFLHTLLVPLRFMVDFVLVAQGTAFFLKAGIMAGAAAVMAGLVVAADHRFEDQAIKTARTIGRVKREGFAGLSDPSKQVLKGESRGFPRLAPLGPVWRALVWKNVLSIGRLRRQTARLILILVPLAMMFFFALRDSSDESKAAIVVPMILFVISVYGSLLGPALLRVDLRLDIPHFDVLKALPIRGRDLLLGEVLGPVIVIFALQSLLIAIGVLLLPESLADWIDWRSRLLMIVTALPALFALDFTLFALENLLALYLPSFVRFGRGMRGGFDQFGQNLLGAIVRGLVLVLLLLPAAIIGGGIALLMIFVFQSFMPLAVFTGIFLGSLVLVACCYGLLVRAERRYERFDLSAETINLGS